MEAFFDFAIRAMLTWWAAAIMGGLLIALAEWLGWRRDPPDADVRRAAERYRQRYGAASLHAIDDHLAAARFAPDSRHKRFLHRVAVELEKRSCSDAEVPLGSAYAPQPGVPRRVRDTPPVGTRLN